MKAPVLFVGHGSPMNALGGNSFAQSLHQLSSKWPKPRAILVISAHWETDGSVFLDAEKPSTIHDFFGFPDELYRIQYPAPGAEFVNRWLQKQLGDQVGSSREWGLDHGAWSVLHHLYPAADVPVTQLSLNTNLDFDGHYRLGHALRPLRDEGVLILASGNIVHNLRELNWQPASAPFPWAEKFDQQIAQALLERDLNILLHFSHIDPQLVKRAVPTPEHYLPLLYALGASEETEPVTFPFTEIQNGSVSMRSALFGG